MFSRASERTGFFGRWWRFSVSPSLKRLSWVSPGAVRGLSLATPRRGSLTGNINSGIHIQWIMKSSCFSQRRTSYGSSRQSFERRPFAASSFWSDSGLIFRCRTHASCLGTTRSLSESWSRDYEVSEPRGRRRRPLGSVAHSRVPKQGLREGLRLFGRDRDASNTLQRVCGARSGATAGPPGRTDPTYPPARAYSRFRFHAVHTRLHSPSAPRNPRR